MKIKKIHSFRWIMCAIIATQQLRHLSNCQFFMTMNIFLWKHSYKILLYMQNNKHILNFVTNTQET